MATDSHWMLNYWVSYFVGADYQQPASHWVGLMPGLNLVPASVIVGDIEEMPYFLVEKAPVLQYVVDQGLVLVDSQRRQVIKELRYPDQ